MAEYIRIRALLPQLDEITRARVAGEYDVASHVAGDTVDVVLVIQFLHGRCCRLLNRCLTSFSN